MIGRIDVVFIGIFLNQIAIDVVFYACGGPKYSVRYPFSNMFVSLGYMRCQIMLKYTFLIYITMYNKLCGDIFKNVNSKSCPFGLIPLIPSTSDPF